MFGILLTTCLFIRYISCELQFAVSNNTLPWLTAHDSCDLLQPDTTTTEDGTTIVEGIRSDTIITESWVGVYRFGYWLSYRGCWDVSVREPNFTTLTVGSCLELCGEDKYGVIGLKNSSCYCYATFPSYSELTCEHSCPTEPFICGSMTKNSASIYSWTKDMGATYHGDGGNCLAIINDGYMWRQCYETLPMTCNNYTMNITGVWRDHIGLCPQQKIENTPNSSNMTWTHTVRSVSTRIHKAEKLRHPYKYIVAGYVFQTNSRTYLKFTSPGEEKRYICLSDREDSTPTNNGNQTEGDEPNVRTYLNYMIFGGGGVLVIVLIVVIVSLRVKCFRKEQRISRERTPSNKGSNTALDVLGAVPELSRSLRAGPEVVNSSDWYEDPSDTRPGRHSGAMAPSGGDHDHRGRLDTWP